MLSSPVLRKEASNAAAWSEKDSTVILMSSRRSSAGNQFNYFNARTKCRHRDSIVETNHSPIKEEDVPISGRRSGASSVTAFQTMVKHKPVADPGTV